MNALTTIHEQHAAEKRRLAAVRDEAAARLSAWDCTTKKNVAKRSELETAYVANATAEGLGQELANDLLDAPVLESPAELLAQVEQVPA